MSDPLTEQYIKSALLGVANIQGFKNVKLVKGCDTAFGEGFVGNLFKVKIEEIDSQEHLNLICKYLPQNPSVENDFQGCDKFEIETYVYQKILPRFVELQLKNGINKKSEGFFNFPICYFASMSPRPLIIMEDLSAKNFKSLGRTEFVHYEQCKMVAQMMGKFHALSLTLKKIDPSCFEEFKKKPDVILNQFSNAEFKLLIWHEFDKAKKLLENNENRERMKITEIQENFTKFLSEMTDCEGSEPFSVVIHADCWINNFMFKFEENSTTDVVLLDWQMSRYASPVLDLLYFLFVNMDHVTRQQHFEDLTNLYHSSCTEFLKKLGGLAEFPVENFKEQLKKYGIFGFVMSVVLIPLLTRPEEYLLKPSEFIAMLKNPENHKEMMAKHLEIHDAYGHRMGGSIDDAIRLGFL